MPETFPTLSKKPNLETYQYTWAVNPTIRSEFENGMVITRSKFENVPLKFTFEYNYLTTNDKELLEDFQKIVKYGTDSFYWESPNSLTLEVRFSNSPLEFFQENKEGYWYTKIELTEIKPNTSTQTNTS